MTSTAKNSEVRCTGRSAGPRASANQGCDRMNIFRIDATESDTCPGCALCAGRARMRHLQTLRLIQDVARAGSIRKAAEDQNITSSALNRRIQAFEAEFGAQIFERLPRGVRLNPAGELLMQHIRSQISDLERIRGQVADLSGARRGHVSIACSPGGEPDLPARPDLALPRRPPGGHLLGPRPRPRRRRARALDLLVRPRAGLRADLSRRLRGHQGDRPAGLRRHGRRPPAGRDAPTSASTTASTCRTWCRPRNTASGTCSSSPPTAARAASPR